LARAFLDVRDVKQMRSAIASPPARVRPDHLVHQVVQVLMENQGLTEPAVHLEKLLNLLHHQPNQLWVNAQSAQLVQLVLLAQVVPKAHLEHKGPQDRKEIMERMEIPDPMDPQEMLVRELKMAKLVRPDHLANLEPLEPKVQWDHKVMPVARDNLDPRERRDRMGRMEAPDQLAQEDPLEPMDLQETKVMTDRLDHLENLAKTLSTVLAPHAVLLQLLVQLQLQPLHLLLLQPLRKSL